VKCESVKRSIGKLTWLTQSGMNQHGRERKKKKKEWMKEEEDVDCSQGLFALPVGFSRWKKRKKDLLASWSRCASKLKRVQLNDLETIENKEKVCFVSSKNNLICIECVFATKKEVYFLRNRKKWKTLISYL